MISHGTDDGQPPEVTDAHEFYSGAAVPFRLRSHQEITGFFSGFDLIEPGLVRIPLWRPDPGDDITRPDRIAGYGGAALKPAP